MLGIKCDCLEFKEAKDSCPSSAEAEYIAATDAACEAIWLRRLLSDLQQKIEEPTVICCDNMSDIAMTKNPVFHARTKHIVLRHHFIRDLVGEGEIQLQFVSTNCNLSVPMISQQMFSPKQLQLTEWSGSRSN